MSNKSSNHIGLSVLGVALALGLIVSAFILSNTLFKIKSEGQEIKVKGYAEMKIKSDLGTWTCNIVSRSFDMVGAYDKLQTSVSKTKRYLLKFGIKSDDMTISSVNTNKIIKRNEKGMLTNEIIGYSLDQSITIKSNNVELIQTIANESTSLIQQGIEIYSYAPQYFYTKLNDLKISMLGKATKDAKLRAEQLAENSGSEVGTLKWASQGVFQITPENSVNVSDYGEYDLSSIDKSIKAVVTIVFTIK